MGCCLCGESTVYKKHTHVDEDSGWWTRIPLCKACYDAEWRLFNKLERLPAGQRERKERIEEFWQYMAKEKARRAQNRVSSLGG